MPCPVLAAYLTDIPHVFRGETYPSARAAFLTAVETIETGFAAGSISNVDYKNAKDTIGRAIEKVLGILRDQHIYGRRDIPVLLRQYDDIIGHPYLNNIPGRISSVETAARINGEMRAFAKTDPYCIAIMAFLQDIAPLASMVTDLKNKVVKRQPKPVEDRKPGYQPPKVTTTAEKQVVALLEFVTQASYNQMKTMLIEQCQQRLDSFVQAVETTDKLRFTPTMHFVTERQRFPDYGAAQLVDLLVEKMDAAGTRERDKYRYRVRPEARAIIEREATETADFYRTQFVHKNFRKIASIVEAKGNLKKGEAAEHTVSLSGLQGTFIFHFNDGSHFTVVNQIVIVINQNRTRFCRFPLTFHNVMLPNGAGWMALAVRAPNERNFHKGHVT